MAETMVHSTTLVVTSCWCGLEFAIPQNRYNWMQQDDSNSCYCPEGHTFHFTTNKRREQERQLQAARDRAGAQAHRAEQAERREKAQRGAATRARNERDAAKKRSAAAVCPCCHRSFKQLRRHMASKHPDYDPAT